MEASLNTVADSSTSIDRADFHPAGGEFVMASISERENREIEAANASGNTPVVFIHGLWLLPSSWANWADFFEQAGYAPLTPVWPDDQPPAATGVQREPAFFRLDLRLVEQRTFASGVVLLRYERRT